MFSVSESPVPPVPALDTAGRELLTQTLPLVHRTTYIAADFGISKKL